MRGLERLCLNSCHLFSLGKGSQTLDREKGTSRYCPCQKCDFISVEEKGK